MDKIIARLRIIINGKIYMYMCIVFIKGVWRKYFLLNFIFGNRRSGRKDILKRQHFQKNKEKIRTGDRLRANISVSLKYL